MLYTFTLLSLGAVLAQEAPPVLMSFPAVNANRSTLLPVTSTSWTVSVTPSYSLSGNASRYVFTGYKENIVRQWELNTGNLIRSYEGYYDSIDSKDVWSVHAMGEYIFAASKDKTIRQWRADTGALVRTFMQFNGTIAFLEDDGQYLYSAGTNGLIIAWNISTGQPVHTMVGHEDEVWGLTFNGEALFSASRDRTARTWDITNGRQCQVFVTNQNGAINAVQANPDYLFTASDDATIKQWEVKNGTEVRTLRGHSGPVKALAIVGPYLLSASQDRTVNQWNISNGRLIRTYRYHDGEVNSIAVVNASTIITASQDGFAKMWTLLATDGTPNTILQPDPRLNRPSPTPIPINAPSESVQNLPLIIGLSIAAVIILLSWGLSLYILGRYRRVLKTQGRVISYVTPRNSSGSSDCLIETRMISSANLSFIVPSAPPLESTATTLPNMPLGPIPSAPSIEISESESNSPSSSSQRPIAHHLGEPPSYDTVLTSLYAESEVAHHSQQKES